MEAEGDRGILNLMVMIRSIVIFKNNGVDEYHCDTEHHIDLNLMAILNLMMILNLVRILNLTLAPILTGILIHSVSTKIEDS